MRLVNDNDALLPRADAAGDLCQECVEELQWPWPDYAKIQALATLSLAETLREVAELVLGRVPQPTGLPVVM